MPNDYKELLRKNDKLLDAVVIQNDINVANNWDDAYWIGEYVLKQASGEADKLIMTAYEKAFELGLNIRVNKKCFLNATQQIAKIYFQFRKYDEAVNMLMVLDSNVEKLPDWVNLYYASAQIHTDTVLYWAEIPELLFKRIDKIDEKNIESVRKRKFLFLEFLNRISEILKNRRGVNVNKDAILFKANQLGVETTRECLNFKVAVGLLSELPPLSDELETTVVVPTTNVSIYEGMVLKLNKKLLELQKIIERQNLEIEQQKTDIKDQKEQIVKLQFEIEVKNTSVRKLSEELRQIKEQKYYVQEKNRILENQISGNKVIRKQIEEDATVISELQVDVEDLKTALSVTKQNNESLRNKIKQNQEIIEQLKSELSKSRENVQGLHTTITQQQVQNADIDISIKNTLQDIFVVSKFLSRKQKILIIGGAEAKEVNIRGKLKSMGFDFEKEQLEFELEYSNIKDYASRIKPWSGKYAGIIVGPCPHKAKDIAGYSSFIEQIKSEEGYPHVEEARDKSGTLKISKTSIGEAMMRMAVYLQSIA